VTRRHWPWKMSLVRASKSALSAQRLERWLSHAAPPGLVLAAVLAASALEGGARVVVLFALAVLAGLALLARPRRRVRRPARPAVPGPLRVPVDTARALAQLHVEIQSGPRAGDVLGNYQLLTCVGEGGMGRVWAARHVGSVLQRLVAVKTAREDEEQRIELRHLFMDEARIALLVRHPNVCGVHEFGEHEGALYQVMEWCDGASLRQMLDRLPDGRMAVTVAAKIIAKVSVGLHAAHELVDDDGVPLHVVHRDVSPQNILISTNGQIKVTDFGVAKAHGQLHDAGENGQVNGKLCYMAPEQVMGREVDRRADIFALGCILYEATTGRGPFAGEGAPSPVYQALSNPVTNPRTWVEDYPEELSTIMLTALGKEPGQRYSTAEQFGVALESWLVNFPAPVVTERTIADLMTQTLGAFIREKAKRIEQALSQLAPPAPSTSETLATSVPGLVLTPAEPMLSLAPARPTVPARPMPPPRPSLSNRPSVAARPTMPAGPAARKPGVPR
jgi:serine/threonine protein kinase